MHARATLRRMAAATTVTAWITLGALAPVYAVEDAAGAAPSSPPGHEVAATAGGSAGTPAETAADAAFEATASGEAGPTPGTAEHQDGGPSDNHTTGPDHSMGNASTQGTVPSPQPESSADENDGGANAYDCEDGPVGPYCATTRHESRNGLGDGEAVGRPAAGSVGRADNKNPPGQEPGPEDGNSGYECDWPGERPNQGIAEGNPAHTGCVSQVKPPIAPEQPVTPEQPGIQPIAQPEQPAAQPVEEVAGVQQERVPSAVAPSVGVLPAAGASDNALMLLGGLAFVAAGILLMHRRAH